MPVRQANADGEQNEYNRTKEIGLIQGIDEWVRLYTDQENRCYKVFPAPAGRFAEPQWPDLKPAKIFRLAFRDKGRLIDSAEHALFKKWAARDSRHESTAFRRNLAARLRVRLAAWRTSGCRLPGSARIALRADAPAVARRARRAAAVSYRRDVLFVSFVANAECACHLALGWPLPAHVLDLSPAFRNLTNGRSTPEGKGLIGALRYFGLDAIGDQAEGRDADRIMQGWPFTPEERAKNLDYCDSDVDALLRLLPQILPEIMISASRCITANSLPCPR